MVFHNFRRGMLLVLGLAQMLLTGCGMRTEPSRENAGKLIGIDFYQIEGLAGGFPIHSNKKTFVDAPEYVCSMQPMEVSGVRNPSPSKAVIAFDWKPVALPELRNYQRGASGNIVEMRRVDCAEFPLDRYRGEATLAKWDDGWRLDSIALLEESPFLADPDSVIFEVVLEGRENMATGLTAKVFADLRQWIVDGKISK
jgi:hypothetical protein